MNTRFIELANKANKEIGYNFSLAEAKQLHELMEKFGELIVRECLTFVEPMPGSGDIDDLALEAAREGIKEHFGVKE